MAESITRKNIDLDILDYYDGKIKNYVDNKVGTGSLTIDDTLSDTSTNPVQNKVVKQAIDNKADSSHTHVKADITDFPESLPANGGNADTVDGLHADDFVNANDRDQIQIPSNVDVPVWIHTNGKRFQRYMTNASNIGLTNVPDNSIDYVWYWYDGMNIIARDNSSRRYFICDMINGVFSGWKDIYTSGNKLYVTGVVVVDSNGKANVSFGFEPSFVLYEPTSPKSGIFGSVYSATTFNATGFTPSADTYTGGLTGNGFSYIAFK